MAAKIKGPLTLGDEAADMDYNATMKDLMGQLVKTPEQTQKDELLAWGGGLTDPNGQGRLGDAFINAGATQSKYRQKEEEIRAQYIPLIMNALATQAQSQALSGISNETLKDMPLERVMQISQVTGRDYLPAWKISNGMETAPAGSYRMGFAGGKNTLDFLPDTEKASPVIQGNTVIGARNLPGVAQAKGETAGATTFGQEVAKNLTGQSEVVDPNTLAKGKVPTAKAYPQPTQFPSLFTGQAAGPSMASGPAPVQAQGPQAGAVPTGPAGGTVAPSPPVQGPATGGTGSASTPATIVNAAGHPQVAPQTQAAADKDAVGALTAELNKVQSIDAALKAKYERLSKAGLVEDAKEVQEAIVRNQQDIPGLQRELNKATYGKPPPIGPALKALAQGQMPAPEPKLAAAPPAADGFVQTELSPGQVRQVKNVDQSTDSARKEYDELLTKAPDFDSEQRNITQLRNGLAGLGNTGDYSTEAQAGVQRLLAAAGVPSAEKYMKNYQLVQQGIGERVNTKIMADRGVATEGDAARHREVEVSLKGKPAYNQYMMDVYQANLDMQKEKLKFYNKFYPKAESSKNGDTGRVRADWLEHKPQLFQMPTLQKYQKQQR